MTSNPKQTQSCAQSDERSKSIVINSTCSKTQSTTTVKGAFSYNSSHNDDTLSMITTPWSTESWSERIDENLPVEDSEESSTFSSYTGSLDSLYASSIQPNSSTTYGIPSPDIYTDTKTSITLLNLYSIKSSDNVTPSPKRNPSSDTFSSWTIQSFHSPGLQNSDSRIIKVKYPWSPETISDTDIFSDVYPSSLASPALRKVSRESFIPSPISQISSENNHITPFKNICLANIRSLCWTGVEKQFIK
ncbi:unnamed protein product [Chilo suppressalis]|uniref:Uncharacterized protein n=1 Tax=Chilo suppressalis TaxID=168631 RepID=A0ABN8AYK5_CHISP|nr:unnamed protein product [Chilo suppressalis]